MALFPTDAKDGDIFAAANGKNYVYQAQKNVWQSTDCVPKWADQVYIRGVENKTQQNVNDTNQEVNVKVGNVATATNQLLDVAFDVRCRGVWLYQGGAVAPGDPPVGLQRFLMTDAEGNKTQQYEEAASLTIHAIGAGQLDKISIGETEIGDLITIQNFMDLSGGSYIVTAIEEFHSDNPDELTDTYAIYTVTADPKRCSGSIATEEKAAIRIIPQQAVPAFEDSEYLKTHESNDCGRNFRIKVNNSTLVSCAGDELGLYHVKAPTDASHAATKDYVDTRLKRTGGTGQKMEGDLYLGGHKIAGVAEPTSATDAANKGYSDTKYLHKAGGTMTGALFCARPDTGGAYLFACEAAGLPENNQIAFRVTGDGAVKAGHNGQNPFMAKDNNDVVTKKYLEQQIEANPGGGGAFISNFDHNYTVTQGSATSPIGHNTVAFLDSSKTATKSFSSMSYVQMSYDDVNPEWITKSGNIKLTDENSTILRGYLAILDYEIVEGKNVTFFVTPNKYGGNTSEISYGSRVSLTWNGAFFGTYDPLWSPS